MEASGTTKTVAGLNTDLDNIQETTKDEREFVGFYVSDTSIKGVAKAADEAVAVLEKVASYIEKAFEEEPKKLKEAKKLVDEIKKKNVRACRI